LVDFFENYQGGNMRIKNRYLQVYESGESFWLVLNPKVYNSIIAQGNNGKLALQNKKFKAVCHGESFRK